MALDAMEEIGVSIRKGLVFAMRTFYRSVHDHPFVACMVFFFIFLYRFCPFLFSFLLSSSPVLVCTAVLLGTLLSFGNPDIPEIAKEEERTHEIASLKAGVVENDLVVQNHESFSVETHVEKKMDIEVKALEESGLDEGREIEGSKEEKDSVTGADDEIFGKNIATRDELNEIHIQNRVIGEEKVEERELLNPVFIEKREFHEEVVEDVSGADKGVGDLFSLDQKKEIEISKEEIDKFNADFLTSHLDDRFDSFPDSSWKQIEDHGESSDSGSDHSESSSPDASIADILPMLDELHPLLDTEAPQPALISLEDSDAASEGSHSLNEGTVESDEEAENQEEEDEEEETKRGQEDGTEAVVTWTDDDQKNLMDLGTSEIERNQRLETLIAKRRARKSLRLSAEKNLIDLESNDPPFHIPPILTRRHNPFDLPFDSNDTMGLPPIPGSAPSVMFQKRNPFDLPYDPLEEKPNLMDDSFQKEFMTLHQKENYFRRHETFSVKSLFPQEFNHERHNIKFRPFFVTERMASEGISYPAFQRQFSDMSDSKASSAPETESLASFAEEESHKEIVKQESFKEDERISHINRVSDRVEGESHSSKEVDSTEIYHKEKRDDEISWVEIKETDEENSYETDLSLPVSSYVPLPVESDMNEISMKLEGVEEKSDVSSSSSSSEVGETVFHGDADKDSTEIEPKRSDCTEAPDNSHRDKVSEGVDESHVKEPVYDSTPLELEKSLSNLSAIEEALSNAGESSLSSNFCVTCERRVEISEVGSHPPLVERSGSFTDGEPQFYNGSIEKEMTSDNEGSWEASSLRCRVDENESRSTDIGEISENDLIKFGFTGFHQNYNDPNALKVLESMVDQNSSDSSSSFSETELSMEGLMEDEEKLQPEKDRFPSSSLNSEIHDGFFLDPVANDYSHGSSSEGLTSSPLEKPPPLMEKSIFHQPSDGDLEESQGLPILQKSIEELNFFNHVDELLVQEPQDKDSLDLYPSISVPPTEYSTDPIDLREDIIDITQNENEDQVFEHLNDSGEAIGAHVTEEEFNDETEAVKEIDERLLLELDTVGDFNVNALVPNTELIEKQFNDEVIESLTGLQVLEASTTEGLESNSEKFIHEADMESLVLHSNLEVEDRIPEMGDSAVDFEVLKESSLENVDFEEFPEGDFEKLTVLEPIHDEPMSQITGVEAAAFELSSPVQPSKEFILEFPVIETISPKYIDLTFKKLEEIEKPTMVELVHNEPTMGEPKEGTSQFVISERDSDGIQIHEQMPVEPEVGTPEFRLLDGGSHAFETDSELTVLEARSFKDIDSVFMQLHGGGDLEKPKFPNSIEEKPLLVEGQEQEDFHYVEEDIIENLPKAVESDDPIVTGLELPVLEASSLEDIDSAFKQFQEEGLEKPEFPNSIEDKPLLVEAQGQEEIHSDVKEDIIENLPKAVESDDPIVTGLEPPVLEASSLEDIDSAFKQLREGPEKPEFSNSIEENPLWAEVQEPEMIHSDMMEDIIENVPKAVESEDLIVTNVELPVLEASSLKDIDSAFKQLREGGLEKLGFPNSLEDESQEVESPEPLHVLSDLEEDNIVNLPRPVESKVPISNDFELPALEAHSLNEIDSSSQQAIREDLEKLILPKSVEEDPHVVKSQESVEVYSDLQEGNMEKRPKPEESNDQIETDLDLLVLEARSLEDIGSAFKKTHEGEFKKSILPQSVDEKPEMLESEDWVEIQSDLQVIEARSLDDIKNLLKPEESERLVEVDAKGVESAKDMESNFENFGSGETSTVSEESNHGVKEIPENSSFDTVDVRRKKAGSHTSSSSSSSSDSD